MSEETHALWKDEYKKDFVYLHVIPRSRARGVVNISPYAIKLELWLRINDIPFEVSDKKSLMFPKFCLSLVHKYSVQATIPLDVVVYTK